VFTPEERTRIRERVFELARADPRITGGAVTGSLTVDAEDRWSDIDTTFGVANDVDPEVVLDEWTRVLEGELEVLHYWDLRRAPTIYRVYLLAGGLELDIAVTPAAEFAKRGPNFRLVFGEAGERPPSSPDIGEIIGYGWLCALTARTRIERGKPWAAEYFISWTRDQALALACVRLGLPPEYARGADRLPGEVTEPYEDGLVRSLEPGELRRALGVVVSAFLAEVGEADAGLAGRLRLALDELID
jgi:hypothetical protein